MRVISKHVTDPPFILRSGVKLRRLYFKGTGSTYGRFIFTEGIVFKSDKPVKDVEFKYCTFDMQAYPATCIWLS